MIAEVEATTSWHILETSRVGKLAATHRLGQTWKREFGFDRIETAAEMDEKRSKRSRTSPISDPFFYSNIINPKRPHTPDQFILEMKEDVERFKDGDYTFTARATATM